VALWRQAPPQISPQAGPVFPLRTAGPQISPQALPPALPWAAQPISPQSGLVTELRAALLAVLAFLLQTA
jgi:hypothetical protein